MSERTYKNDKKKNSSYWDEIDNIVEDCFRQVALCSSKEIDLDELDEYCPLCDFVSEVRDYITYNLNKYYGCEFPYVEGNL